MTLEFDNAEVGQAVKDLVIKKFGYKPEQVGPIEISKGKAANSVRAECVVETDPPAATEEKSGNVQE